MYQIVYEIHEIEEIAVQLVNQFPSKVIALNGVMGAGKTTLIKALLNALGSHGTVQSPTFGLVNEYADKGGDLLAFHFDFYRLEDENEALDFGLEDYFSANCWIFMEWPEKINNLLPENITELHIEVISSTKRMLSFRKK